MPCNFGSPQVPARKLKYFFGYHLVNGIKFSFMWVEDDGHVVGGIPEIIGDRLEITKEEFETSNLADLEKEHPPTIDLPLIPLKSSEEPNST